MRAIVRPSVVSGNATVPGDKSIAHRWLILAAIAEGRSDLLGLPTSLDVRSTAMCLSNLMGGGGASLEAWARNGGPGAEGHGSTWNSGAFDLVSSALEVEGEGRDRLCAPLGVLDCGNSGTTMRLLSGMLAGCAFEVELTGDETLRRRPMERVAEPLRLMGAQVATTDGHAPITVTGTADLRAIRFASPVPSAQVKSAVLLAGLAADGETVVEESVPTRDHTERALAALGAPVIAAPGRVSVRAFDHAGFDASVPGDPSSAAFLVAAAALTGSEILISGVGLNPTRTRFLTVLERMGVRVDLSIAGEQLGEPVGEIHIHPCQGLTSTDIAPDELPLVIDEAPVLALVAAHADGQSRFSGAGELRVKESDRLAALVTGLRSLGGDAAIDGDDLVVGAGGLAGGHADAGGDHRMAMAFAVGALAASAPCTIEGIESADVSFPGFVPTLSGLGASIEVQA